MTPPRLAAALVLAALAVSCGGRERGLADEVKNALVGWLSSAEAGNARALCDGMTPGSRRLVDVVARGRSGPNANCTTLVTEQAAHVSGGLAREQIQAIDAADVDVDGATAQVRDDTGGQITMRKVGGEWLVDFATVPGQAYGLRASAACTQANLDAQRRPLPGPTRRGMADQAERERGDMERLLRALREAEPPEGMEDEHETMVRVVRASIADWRRAVSAMRAAGEPIATYRRAMRALDRRSRAVADEASELGFGCLGHVSGRSDAREYRVAAARICRTAKRRLSRLSKAALPRRGPAIVGAAARALRRVDSPDGLAAMHRSSAAALGEAYAQLPRLAGGGDLEAAQERFELSRLRASIGFDNIGLDACAQL